MGATPPPDTEPKYLPVYTILVPLYKESAVVPQLLQALQNLDYPKDRLDIKLVVEEEDTQTQETILLQNPPRYMQIIRVPDSHPKTKPKACNYALQFARGSVTAIFDAEDIPDPRQLKLALLKFEEDPKIACVQARLNYYNINDNFLTRWFALEYAIWFNFVMQGLAKLGHPLPLGGTSNHVKTSALKEVGGWDAFNVTEDADLGLRLSRFGYKSAAINSLTREEAPNEVWPWIKQRTRWIKGFMQTFIVQMREPRFCPSLTFFIGAAPLIFLATLPMLAAAPFFAMPNWLLYLSVFNLAYSAISHVAYCVIAKDELPSKYLFWPALTFPLYCVMHIIAAYRALYQLVAAPSYWDKTTHGRAKSGGNYISVYHDILI